MPAAKDETVPAEILSRVIEDALKDPGLPRKNPTDAFWQIPVHESVATYQSDKLPPYTDIAVIGSGVTGCSVVKNLLENGTSPKSLHITVLEARTLTSGATGRNGGHLVSPVPGHFTHFEEAFGREQAVKIARFANRTLESMHQLGQQSEELVKAAEVRRVRCATGYRNADTLHEVALAIERYDDALPECRGDTEIVNAAEAEQRYNLKDVAGAEVQSAGAFWPYRLITATFAQLLRTYPKQLAIETQTPVLEVAHDATADQKHPYLLTTLRGEIRATRVIHCTNGWTGHLLPLLRGKIWPLRGTMSVQAPTPSLPLAGQTTSWSTIDRRRYDPTDQTISYGLYYITQNAHTGDVFIGGERSEIDSIVSSDDTSISKTSATALSTVLPSIFAKGWDPSTTPEVRSMWSGIMGFTPDGVPWVGKLPPLITGREGDGEWVAAGFNGYGMPLCWGCGESVAKQVLGVDVNDWFPESFSVSPERWNSPKTTVEAGIAGLISR